jgi:hypothetical protein
MESRPTRRSIKKEHAVNQKYYVRFCNLLDWLELAYGEAPQTA